MKSKLRNSLNCFTLSFLHLSQVLDVNERPTDIFLSNSTVAENSPYGTIVGNLTVVDPDDNGPRGPRQQHYCRILNTHNNKFIVNTTDQASLTVLVIGYLNFEISNVYVITINCNDNGDPRLSYTKTFRIKILDMNEKPTEIYLSNTIVQENSGNTSVGKLTTADPDNEKTLVQSFTYLLIIEVHNSLPFVIDGDVLKTTKGLDYETKSSWIVTVKSADNKGLFFFDVISRNRRNTFNELNLVQESWF